MALAIDPNATFEYVLTCDRELKPEDPGRSVFVCKRIPFGEWKHLQNDFSEQVVSGGRRNRGPKKLREKREVRTRTRSGDMAAYVLDRCLVEVRNYRRPDGTAIEWPSGTNARLAVLDTFDPDHVGELLEAITGGSQLSTDEDGDEGDDGKNS